MIAALTLAFVALALYTVRLIAARAAAEREADRLRGEVTRLESVNAELRVRGNQLIQWKG